VACFREWRAVVGALRALARKEVAAGATSIDYVDVADPSSLTVLDDAFTAGRARSSRSPAASARHASSTTSSSAKIPHARRRR